MKSKRGELMWEGIKYISWEGIKGWFKSDFWLSTIGLWIGWLAFISGITQVIQKPKPEGDNFFVGQIMLLGIYVYRSQKKRKLRLKKNSKLRKTVEIGLLLIMIIAVLSGRNLLDRIYDHPISHLVVPIWGLAAYIVVWIKTYPTNRGWKVKEVKEA